jgi:hypothetical protein
VFDIQQPEDGAIMEVQLMRMIPIDAYYFMESRRRDYFNIDVTPYKNTSYTYTLTEKLSNSCSQTGSIDVYVTIPNDKDGDGVGDILIWTPIMTEY